MQSFSSMMYLLYVIFENKINNKKKDKIDMKMNVILKTVVVILFTALLSIGNMFGQTSVANTAQIGTQASATQSAVISAARVKAASVLANILADNNKVPMELYPPQYITQLKGTANGTLPVNKMIMFNTITNANLRPTHLKPGNKTNMKWLDATFLMGSPTTEAERNSDESQHTAIISYGFYMGNFEVTQDEYQQVVGNNPSYFTSANGYTDDLDRPVENVTWSQANNYCALLTAQALTDGSIPSGWSYRLPTEAEWEYSCRTTGSSSQPGQVLYSQTDTSYEYDFNGVILMGRTFGSIFIPTNNAAVSSIKVRMRLYSTSGTVSFRLYWALNSQPLVEIDMPANDPLFAPAQGSFADITVPVQPGLYANYLYNGVGIKIAIGCPEGYEMDLEGLASDGAFYPYMTIIGSQNANPFTAFSFGDTIIGGEANFDDYYEYNALNGTINVSSPTVPYLNMTTNVGSYQANAFGLYDMHGNVSEWCQDYYGSYPTTTLVDYMGPSSGTTRVVRGGSWADAGTSCRSAIRSGVNPSSANSHIGFRIVLSSTTPDWKTAIQTQPPAKVYGIPPTKDPTKDGLVLITHGWQPSVLPPNVGWVDTMSSDISTHLSGIGVVDWQVYGYKWVPNALKANPDDALNNATQEGISLGNSIVNQGWTKVHFIAHSAGAQLIQTATEVIRSRAPSIVVQCTFLDPYVGTSYVGQSTYGYGADWSDRYSSHGDIEVGGGIFTDVPLYSSYNVDITALDQSLANSGLFTGLSGYILCVLHEATHGWAIQFYENSITGNTNSDYDGFGFPLSDEAGGWPSAPTQYPVGNVNSVKILGTAPQSCSLLGALAATAGIPIDFTASPIASQSTSGTITTSGGTLTLITGSPAWLSIVPTNTNPVNLLSFDANFTSTGTGAAGLLSVLWDSSTIGTVDERTVGQGVAHYTLPFPVTESNSTHVLSFRLDPFTNVQSTVVITNVVLNQQGVTQPFSLSVVTNGINGSIVYKLTGQAGFDYGLQASTNLIDWTQIAVLENTNGVVNFSDQNSTNYPYRFYRAVAPY